MIERKPIEKQVIEEIAVRITCDICHKVFDLTTTQDEMEVQEFHRIDFVGGYGSVFGDTYRVQCDICQNCLLKLLGNKARISSTEETIIDR